MIYKRSPIHIFLPQIYLKKRSCNILSIYIITKKLIRKRVPLPDPYDEKKQDIYDPKSTPWTLVFLIALGIFPYG